MDIPSVRLTIDGREARVPAGSTVLDAARALGIRVPTLCREEGYDPNAACLLCVVRDEGAARLVPSCAARAEEGMRIRTDAPEAEAARRAALELLFSEHVGDCEAPCQVACASHMEIPRMIRHIARGRFREALAAIKGTVAFPAVLARVCTVPCETVCRRALHDGPVAIGLLKRFVAEADLASGDPWRPPAAPETGRRVAVAGAGATGLSAAWFLRLSGHAVTLIEREAEPGGGMRTFFPRDVLPAEVVEAEIRAALSPGIDFRPRCALGRDVSLDELRRSHDAVVLAVGRPPEGVPDPSIPAGGKGIAADLRTLQTPVAGVFAGGTAVLPLRQIGRSFAHGRALASSVNVFLGGSPLPGTARRFNFRLGPLVEGEMAEFLRHADPRGPVTPAGTAGFTAEEAQREAARCLHCDCRKKEACRLRDRADELLPHVRRFRGREREPFRIDLTHPRVAYEPGKCIRCGSCLQAARRAGGGLCFIGRGFRMKMAPPPGVSLEEALRGGAADAVSACPTGALAWKEEDDG